MAGSKGFTKIVLQAVQDMAAAGATHAQRIAKARKELTAAEALLKAGGAKPKRFLATFRLKDALSLTKGSYAERREHLEVRLKALNGVPHHVSTSAWSLRTHHETAGIILAALRPAIDEAVDFLQVEQTGAPVSAGVSKLKS